MNLFLEKMELLNYKSHGQRLVDFHPKLNAILGFNGVGKTNLLDAIYYTCLGKSYFSSGDRNVLKKGEKFFRMVSHVRKGDYVEKFIAKVKPGKLKELSVDGKRIARLGDHIGRYPCVIIAPHDVQLLLEGSMSRRNFMNSCLIQSDQLYIQHLIKYNKLLKQRNALLKDFLDRKYFDQTLLTSISIGMYEPAKYIHESRENLAEEISVLFAELYTKISGKREKCEIRYKSALKNDTIEEIFAERIEKDRVLGRTTQGTHRDDLVFLMNGSLIKPYGSQGQLKSFVISLKLAQYHHLAAQNGIKPILLLDDLFDKLDNQRVAHLLTILHEEKYGQVIITDKDKNTIVDLLEKISSEYAIFAIDEDSPQHSEEE